MALVAPFRGCGRITKGAAPGRINPKPGFLSVAILSDRANENAGECRRVPRVITKYICATRTLQPSPYQTIWRKHRGGYVRQDVPSSHPCSPWSTAAEQSSGKIGGKSSRNPAPRPANSFFLVHDVISEASRGRWYEADCFLLA